MRARLPPVYNSARLCEHPIPPTEFVDANQVDIDADNPQAVLVANENDRDENVPTVETDEAEQADNAEQNASEHGNSEANSTDEVVDGNDGHDSPNTLNAVSNQNNAREHEQDDDLNSTFFESDNQNGSSQFDVKPTVEDDQEDLMAYEQLCSDGTNAATNDVDPLICDSQESVASNVSLADTAEIRESFERGIQIESTRVTVGGVARNGESGGTNSASNKAQNASDVNDSYEDNNGDTSNNHNEVEVQKRAIEKSVRMLMMHGENIVVDSDLEYLHIPGQVIRPKENVPKYQVKAGDILCGNIPFKQVVNCN